MMSAVTDARAALVAAVKAIEPAAYGELEPLREYDDPGATIDPPAFVVSLPDLEFDSHTGEPTEATFSVALIVAADGRAVELLADYVLIVTRELWARVPATVGPAQPGSWNDTLPAYLIDVEYPL